MLNHCENVLWVHGQPLAVKAFIDKAKAGADALSFHAFVPQPAELIMATNGMIEKRRDDAPDPISWRYKHWGTKLDAYDFEDGHEEDPGETSWLLTFYTAWSPPIPVIQAMQAQHPELSIELRFSEPGNGILGVVRPSGRVEEVELSLPDEPSEKDDFDPYHDGTRDFLYD